MADIAAIRQRKQQSSVSTGYASAAASAAPAASPRDVAPAATPVAAPVDASTKPTPKDRIKWAQDQQELEQSDTDMCKHFGCGNKAQSGMKYCSRKCFADAKKCILCGDADKESPGRLGCFSCVERHTLENDAHNTSQNKPHTDEDGYTLVGDVVKDAAAEPLATSVAEEAIEESNRFSALGTTDEPNSPPNHTDWW